MEGLWTATERYRQDVNTIGNGRFHSSKYPCSSHTLYMDRCARGAMPDAVPLPLPSTLAPCTNLPAAVLAVCVPWPTSSSGASSGSWPRIKDLPPISFLLQRTPSNLQEPRHLVGGAAIPSSSKEVCAKSIPVSSIPTTIPSPMPTLFQAPPFGLRLRKSGVWVVKSGRKLS
ncbi:hypothetical protein U9M48_032410, partial [Paspalum notatum var. saurae]